MTRFTFSLRILSGMVLCAAFACAALRQPSNLWASLAFTVTIGVLVLGVVGILLRRGADRAFWVGFALFGWSYLALVFAPWFDKHVGPRLVTTELFSYLHRKSNPTAAGLELERKLDQPIDLDFSDTPLSDVLYSIRTSTGIQLVIDGTCLEDEGISTDTPVTIKVGGMPLRSVFRLLLGQHNLEFVVENDEKEVLTNRGFITQNDAFVLLTSMSARATLLAAQTELTQRTGHSLVTLWIAFLGGVLARSVVARNPGAKSGTESGSPTPPSTAAGGTPTLRSHSQDRAGFPNTTRVRDLPKGDA